MDADGNIYISKKNNIYIEINLDEKDLTTLYKLRKILGFGNISKKSKVKSSIIRFSKSSQLVHILNLINGKL